MDNDTREDLMWEKMGHDGPDEDEPCEFCKGRGWIAVEPNSSLKYSCPDCEGDE
jgi:hypothetical protein